MNIWEILGIEPTTDKRRIKKAYAEKTKEIHPEEKPEEFKRLHEAYQAALGYADYISKANGSDGREIPLPNAEQGAVGNTDEDAGQEDLLSYFEESQEKNQQCVDAFIKRWNAYKSAYSSQETLDWWKEYLFSEEFQDIRFQSQVVHLLAGEMTHGYTRHGYYHNAYMTDEIKTLFWDAYGFQEYDEIGFHGDLQKLWKYLNPNRIRQQKKERAQRIARGAAIIVILLFCVWGAYITDDGRVLIPIVVALLYYTRNLFADMQE